MVHQGMSKKQAAKEVVKMLADVKIPNPEVVAKQYPHPVSYTHLDVYKRQLLGSLFGASAQCSGYYPGWKYEAQSPLREIMKKVFFELYHEPLKCLVGHGGNECGVFKKMFPEMDIVTSGAIYGNIHGPQDVYKRQKLGRKPTLITLIPRLPV